MKIGLRLAKYAALYKRTILIALLMLTVSVVADLSGPFIAKTMIDRHILGIERTWYMVPKPDSKSAQYRGHWYERSDYLPKNAQHGATVTLLQVGHNFYFISRELPFTGNPTVAAGRITVHQSSATGAAQAVSTQSVRGATASAGSTGPTAPGTSGTLQSSGSLTVPATTLTRQELFAFYQPEISPMFRLAGLYVILLVISSLLSYGQSLLLQISANRILQRMRRDVFAQIHRLPVRYFDNLPAGKVVSRITNDTEAIRDFYVTVLANVVSGVVNMIGIYIALSILNAQLALVCSLLVPILLLWITLYRKYAVAVNHKIRSLLSEINAMMNETIQGIPVIRAFHRQQRTSEEFEALNKSYYDGQIHLLAINSATGFNLAGALRNVFLIALISYFGWRYFHLAGAISFGALYAFVDYIGRLFQPVTQIVNQLSNLEQARVAAQRVFKLLDEPGVNVVDGSMQRYRGDVTFSHVHFSYDGKQDVLRDISFRAHPGQTVALVGHTGSGKSSIMNLLFRFYDAKSGLITIDGVDISTLPRQHLRKHMGIVLQDPFLFTGTIASNVSLGNEEISRSSVADALRAVGAEDLLKHLPNGWDEPVLEKGSTLSAGQRQLISFARALAFDPAILVLDEATSSIDTETEAVIQEALEVLKRGRTTFIIAHRLSTIRQADLILVLDKGAIVERGNHDDLMARHGRYYQMYELQQGGTALRA